MERLNRLLDVLSARSDESIEELERQVWEEFGVVRAVLVLDMSGFTRIVREKGIVYYLILICEMQRLARPIVEEAGGAVIKFEADDMFATFETAAAAVEAAVKLQRAFSSGRIRVSIGLSYGRLLMVPGRDFFGDCVNIASKLGEDVAQAGEILFCDAVADGCRGLWGERVERVELEPGGSVAGAWRLRWSEE